MNQQPGTVLRETNKGRPSNIGCGAKKCICSIIELQCLLEKAKKKCWVVHSKLWGCVCWQVPHITADIRGWWSRDEEAGSQERTRRDAANLILRLFQFCARQQMVCRRRVTADQWTPNWLIPSLFGLFLTRISNVTPDQFPPSAGSLRTREEHTGAVSFQSLNQFIPNLHDFDEGRYWSWWNLAIILPKNWL